MGASVNYKNNVNNRGSYIKGLTPGALPTVCPLSMGFLAEID